MGSFLYNLSVHVNSGRRYLIVSLFFAAICLATQYSFFTLVPIGFDESWHVFIFNQRSLREVIFQLSYLAHPPVYFLFNHLLSYLSNSFEFYKLLSVLYGLANLALFGLLLYQLKVRLLPFSLGLALFTFSINLLILNLSIRSYSLMLMLVLLSLNLYLCYSISPKDKLYLCLSLFTATLAIFTHFAAAMIFLGIVCLAVIHYRKVKIGLFIYAVVNLLALFFYLKLVDGGIAKLSYLKEHFYYGERSIFAFIFNNLDYYHQYLLPLQLPIKVCLLLLICYFLFSLNSIIRVVLTREADEPLKFTLLLLPLVLLLGLALASVLKLYPFGGHMRHQFFLIPFGIIAIVLFVNQIKHKTVNVVLSIALLSVAIFNFNIGSFKKASTNNFWLPADAIKLSEQNICNHNLYLNFYHLASNFKLMGEIEFTREIAPRFREYRIKTSFCNKPIKLLLYLSYNQNENQIPYFQSVIEQFKQEHRGNKLLAYYQ